MQLESIALVAAAAGWAVIMIYTRRATLLRLNHASEDEAALQIRRWARLVSAPLVIFAILGEVLDFGPESPQAWWTRLLVLLVVALIAGGWTSFYLAWMTRRDWKRGQDSRTGQQHLQDGDPRPRS